MSDIINNSLAYLIPQKEQKLRENFAELDKSLTEYKNEIFNSLYINQEDFNSKIGNKLRSIKESIKPYHILKQGYEFIKTIEKEISQAKNKKKDGIRFFPFYDSRNIIRCVLEDSNREWVGEHPRIYYKTRSDERLDDLYKGEENKAYKFIRDSIQKFIDDNKKQGIEIWLNRGLYEETERFYDLCINYRLSEKVLNNTESENTESSESMDEIPELENENYKIDTHLSVEEKLKSGRTKEKDFHGIIYLQKDLSPEQKYKDDKAYVREYLEGVDKEYIGEQKYNREAVKKLGLVNKLPKNFKEFKKIRGNNHQDFVNKYFSKNNKSLFSGYWNPGAKGFFDVGDKEHCWLSNGRHVLIDKNSITYYGNNHCFGHSIRLVKGR